MGVPYYSTPKLVLNSKRTLTYTLTLKPMPTHIHMYTPLHTLMQNRKLKVKMEDSKCLKFYTSSNKRSDRTSVYRPIPSLIPRSTLFIFSCIDNSKHTRIHTHTHTQTHTHTHTQHTCTHPHPHPHTHTQCSYIHTHTHTHTQCRVPLGPEHFL